MAGTLLGFGLMADGLGLGFGLGICWKMGWFSGLWSGKSRMLV
ncbi:hypothetical protein [Bdellovibrio svalbardensis]|nr:hypothetical protein [Bdellovibrio svalbardensis]